MSFHGAAIQREPGLRESAAAEIVAAAKRALGAYGKLPPPRRKELVALLAPGIAFRRRDGVPAATAAAAELEAEIERWLATSFGPEAPIPAAFRVAFRDIDGAARWPQELLKQAPRDDFVRAVASALPRPLPPEAPLEMADQSF